MSRRLGTALVALLVAAGGLVGPAGPADAATPGHTVTVTPSTGLSDGQTVTVSGTGFVETPVVNDWAIATCRPQILTSAPTLDDALSYCDVTTAPFVFTHADASGNLSTSYTVRKSFPSGGTTITCGQAPNDCAILVAQLTSAGFVGAAAPISFGKPVPTRRDCITTFLADHEHRPVVKLHRLLVCLWTAIANKPH
jgi:hypothetical protein